MDIWDSLADTKGKEQGKEQGRKQGKRVKDKLRGLVLGRIRPVMLAVAFLAALLVISSRLVDEGEIVMITTLDSQGRDQVTELWIVELPSGTFLRAGSPDAAWLERLQAQPEVTLERDGAIARFRAVPENTGSIREKVNEAMSAKYGFADRLWGQLADRSLAVPIRLHSVTPDAP